VSPLPGVGDIVRYGKQARWIVTDIERGAVWVLRSEQGPATSLPRVHRSMLGTVEIIERRADDRRGHLG
jgi:hypothetical protein